MMFDDPISKVEWAHQHIRYLQRTIDHFIDEGNFYRLFTDVDDEGNSIVVFEITGAIPKQIGLMISDVAHNLRATLDYLACDLQSFYGSPITNYTRFPFRDSREKLVSTITGAKKEGSVLWKFVDLIADKMQPYPGGDGAPLHSLHALDIQNKHLLLTPTFSASSIVVSAQDYSGGITIKDTLCVFFGNGRMQPISCGVPLKITDYKNPTFEVRFAKGQPFEGEAVVPTLIHLAKMIRHIINLFAEACQLSAGSAK